MIFRSIQFRHRGFSLKEKRLLGYRQTLENAPEASEATREVARAFLVQVKIDLKDKDPEQRLEVLKSRFSTVTTPELAEALVEESEEDSDIQVEAKERVRIIKESSERRRKLSEEAEATKRKKEKEAAAKKAKGEKGFIEKGKDKVVEYWDSLKPETQSNIQAVAVATGAVAVAVAAWKVGRWFFFGTKKVVEKTTETAKKGWGFFKTAAVATAVGLAGFLGFKAIESYLKNSIIAAAEKKLAAAQKLLTDAKARVGAYTEAQIAAAEATVKESKAIIARELAALKKKKKEAPSDTPPKDKVEEGGEEDERVADDEVADDEVADDEEDTDEEERIRKAELVAGAASIPLIARGLVTFEPMPEWVVPEDAKIQHMTDVLSTLTTNNITVGELFSRVTDDSVDPSLVTSKEDVESHKQALILLTRFCRAQRGNLESGGMTAEEIDALPLEKFIKAVGASYGVAGTIVENIKNNNGDITAALKDTDIGDLMEKSGGLQGEIESFIQDNETSSRLDDLDTVDLMLELPNFTMSVGEFKGNYEEAEEHSAIETVILEICEEMETMKTHQYMVPFFHSIFPSDSVIADAPNDIERCRLILNSRLSVAEAVRFHMYARMMKRNNAVGVVLMQSEIFKYVTKNDEGYFGKGVWKDKKYLLIDRIAKVSTGGAWREFDDLDVEIDEEKVREALRKMGKIGSSLGLGALGGIVGTIKEGFVAFGTFAAKNPVLIGGPSATLATAASYLKYRSYRINTRPRQVIRNLEGMKAGRMADNGVVRNFRGLEISRGTITTAERSMRRIQEGIDALQDAAHPGFNKIDEVFHNCTSSAFRSSESSWRRLATTLSDEGVTGMQWVDDVAHFRDTPKMRACISIAAQPYWGRIKEYGKVLTSPISRPVRNLNMARHVREVGAWKTAGWVAGMGMQAYVLYGDVVQYQEMDAQEAGVRKMAKDSLAEVSSRLDSDPNFTKKSEGVYIHTESGFEISIKESRKDLGAISDVFDDRKTAQGARVAGDATALYAMAVMGPRIAMGPAGLVVVGVELAIRTGVDAWEESNMRAFITSAPPWLLAYLGTQATTGKAEYEWLRGTSSWMISDFWPDGVDNEKDKKEIQNRMLFTMFYQDLAIYAPEVMQEVTAGMDSPEKLKEFYESDFQKMVLPTFHALLLRQGDGNESWESVRDGGGIDSGVMIVPPNFTRVQISAALRESAVLYTQHLRETRYLYYARILEEQQNTDGVYVEPGLEDTVELMGDVRVFGKELSRVSLGEYSKNKSRTRAELVMEALATHLNTTKGSTRREKIVADAGLYTVPQSTAAGLPGDIDLSSMTSIAGFLDDPALSQQLQQVLPTTLEEEVAVNETRWNDWQTHFDNLLVMPGSPSQTADSLRYGAAFWVGDKVSGLLGEPKVSPTPGIFGALTGTRSGDGLSFEGAQKYITTGMERYFERPNSKRTFRANSKMGDELYGSGRGPAVFTSGVSTYGKTLSLCRELKYPTGLSSSKELKFSDLKTVFFEGVKARGEDEYIVMATYIFGDPKTGKVSIAKQAIGRANGFASNGAMGRASAPGTVEWSTTSAFLKKPGAEAMLGQSAESQVAREAAEVEREAAAKRAREEYEAKAPEREAAEKQRKRQELEMASKEFAAAVEKVEETSDSYFAIGGTSLYLMFDSSRKNYVILRPRSYSRGPSISASPTYSYGDNRIRPKQGDDDSTISEHSSIEGALYYFQNGNYKGRSSSGYAEHSIWGLGYLDKEEGQHYDFLMPRINKPVSRNSEDVHRIIDMADQIINNPRFFGSRRWYGTELKKSLSWKYEKLKTDDQRSMFLNKLIQLLRQNDHTVTFKTLEKIKTWFASHPRTFRREKW